MTAPDFSLFLAFASLPTALFSGLSCWRFKVTRRWSYTTAIGFALGLAFAVLVVAVASTYIWPVSPPMRVAYWLPVYPVVAYAGSVILLGRIGKLPTQGLVIVGVLGLIPFAIFSPFVWLFTACSFGDCL